jgi:hypothetical protein
MIVATVNERDFNRCVLKGLRSTKAAETAAEDYDSVGIRHRVWVMLVRMGDSSYSMMSKGSEA